ncbi:ATP-dependent DNA ligase [Stackebrandtia endophytica]|uniref:DNA ligase (ATP) n=1 Tax=Stackebrandtia endophytica TaxID=1496996 RepID=A0A543AUS3_9ACTN|nr:ATP-dependent DNA ligase [Stackebrandtia endophytica]TQL76297.1 ATP-dependent DNA ligase [Stackebrandtia endophytica]
MDLPVMPPIKPMLAKPVAKMPQGDYLYEPKWDGFRAIVFRDGDDVEIGSRNVRPITRYFPELVEAFRRELPQRCVLDGEIVIASGDRLDFEALQQRIHPAKSRVDLLSRETPASFVAFDVLALDDVDLRGEPMARRHALLREALAGVSAPVHLTPVTGDSDVATQWFTRFEGAGLDGVVAKPVDVGYQSDKRLMLKVKHTRTADCVVAGYRVHKSGPDRIGSLLLGLYTAEGDLANVGAIGAFTAARRAELFTELQPLVTDLAGHPWAWEEQEAGNRTPMNASGSRWAAGKDLSFVPLRPELVVEVKYDHLEGDRFRHTAQFVRWRPDRTPESCTYEQLEEVVKYDLAEVLSSGD